MSPTPEAEFRPVPGWNGYYEINAAGEVRGIRRTIIRRNGWPYSVQPRILSASAHPTCRPRSVLLGRPGVQQRIYPHLVVRRVFGAREVGTNNDWPGSDAMRPLAAKGAEVTITDCPANTPGHPDRNRPDQGISSKNTGRGSDLHGYTYF